MVCVVGSVYALCEEGVQVLIVWFFFKAIGPYVLNKPDKRLWQTLKEPWLL